MIERHATTLDEISDSLSCEVSREKSGGMDSVLFTGQDGKRFIVRSHNHQPLVIERETGFNMTLFKAWKIIMCADDNDTLNASKRRAVEDDPAGAKSLAEELVQLAYDARECNVATSAVSTVIDIYEKD